MKKHILTIFGIIILSAGLLSASAKNAVTPEVNSAIKLYKEGNYTQCYFLLQDIIKKDASNGLAFYYMAMTSAQIGKRDEAMENYDKAINLSPNGILGKYAKKGKACLLNDSACWESEEPVIMDPEEQFIKGKYGSGFSDSVRSDYERQKLQNLMREINRGKDVQPQNFKEYKDFSSEMPTNDEIVAAMRVLQRAGLANMAYGDRMSELSLLSNGYENNNNEYAILNMLTGKDSSKLNPQMIQSLLTNQLSVGF